MICVWASMFIAICIYTIFIHICPCHAGDILRHYKVFFSLEIICEPAAPVGVINVQCASLVSSETYLLSSKHSWTGCSTNILYYNKHIFSSEHNCAKPQCGPGFILEILCSQSLVDIEIPVNNPRNEQLMLDVYLEGDNLTGPNWVLIPALETLTYKATYSPGSIGKTTGRYV